MKTLGLLVVLVIACFVVQSCSRSSKYQGPVLEPSAITRDMISWLYYDRDQVQWSADFQPLDTSSLPMKKPEFLKLLTTGNYLPVRIRTRNSSLCYQLYRIDDKVDKDIRETIKNKAQTAYRYLQLVGNSFDRFQFY